jgi:uncharacterized protein
MSMHLIELSDAATFLQRSNALLMSQEARNNLLLSSALTLAKVSAGRSPRLSFFIVEQDGQTLCAALNSLERRLLLSTSTPEAAAFMGREFARQNTALKGVLGPSESTLSFCESFSAMAMQASRGHHFTPKFAQKILRLDSIDRALVLAPGLSRVAKEKDLKLLMKWSRQFVAECGLDETESETDEVVRRYLENRQLFVWEHNRTVAMAGFGGITPNGVRVNMVYTDPASRGRGYAGSLVHILSRKLLAGGHRYCFLFTDAANPSANRLYERIGYRHVGDFTEYRL